MRLTRVYIEAAPRVGEHLVIEGKAANHLLRVLRLRAGDPVTLFAGNGSEFGARVEELRKSAVAVAVLTEQSPARESPLHLTLLQGISRADRMDLVVQKATELGVARVVPLFTERSVVRLDAAQARAKLDHWRAVAIAACEQCGRNRIPEIAPPRELASLEDGLRGEDLRLLLSPSGGLRIREIEPSATRIALLIGPEGGLAGAEEERVAGHGFQRVRLGPRILRTETAALAALALLQGRLGDL